MLKITKAECIDNVVTINSEDDTCECIQQFLIHSEEWVDWLEKFVSFNNVDYSRLRKFNQLVGLNNHCTPLPGGKKALNSPTLLRR